MEFQRKMFKLVEDWKTTPLTKSEFSTLHNITYHSFNYWIKKYNKIHGTSMTNSTCDDASLSFFNIPKSINPSKKQSSEKPVDKHSKRIEIVLDDGVKITIY